MTENDRDSRTHDIQETVHRIDNEMRAAISNLDTRVTVLERRADWQREALEDLKRGVDGAHAAAVEVRDMLSTHATREDSDRTRLLVGIILLLVGQIVGLLVMMGGTP